MPGKYIHDALGGTVPIGLISNNWCAPRYTVHSAAAPAADSAAPYIRGGTPVQVWSPLSTTTLSAVMHAGDPRVPQVWMPLSATKACTPTATVGGSLYNSMVAPYTVGPMALRGATW